MVKLFSWMLLGIWWAQQVLTKYTRDLYPSILENFLAVLDNFMPFIFTLSELLLGGYYTLWPSNFIIFLFFLPLYLLVLLFEKNTLYILEQFRVRASVNGRYRGCPCTPGPYACIASHTLKIPYQNGTLMTVDELTWTHHNHLKSILYIRVHAWCCIHYGFWKMPVTCVYHYGIIQNRFTSLKILSAPPIHLSLFTNS